MASENHPGFSPRHPAEALCAEGSLCDTRTPGTELLEVVLTPAVFGQPREVNRS